MAATGIKFDDGSGAFVSNCFPVRQFIKFSEQGEGAWLEAHRAEQRRKFKAIVCSRPPRTYSRLRQERLAAERHEDAATEVFIDPKPKFDGFFLMKHCCVDDPSDLCSFNIAGKELETSQPDDFALFDNVAYINAAENYLTLDIFNKFPILRELELPLNEVSSIALTYQMFRSLEMLDLSYNRLSPEDIIQLGCLRSLKVLYLSGNNLEALPENLAGYYVTANGYRKRRFPKLEILCLDDNKLNNYTAFAPLAGLKELKHLNLEKNEISAIPQLEPKTIKHDRENTQQDVLPPEKDAIKEEDENAEEEGLDEEGVQTARALEFDFNSAKQQMEQTEIEAQERERHDSDSEDELDNEDERAVPFPQLRFLTVAHNYLTEEEDLLPLAAWPNLTQVHIYDNPLVNERSGDPPMLKKFLTDRLGIQLTRKEPPVPKPVKEFPPARKERKVTTNIPPVPRCDVEKLLMIEASTRQQALPHTPAAKSPLPPIGSPSDYHKHKVDQEVDDEPAEQVTTEQLETVDKHEEQDDGGAFFITQVDNQTTSHSAKTKTEPKQEPTEPKDKRKSHQIVQEKPVKLVKNLTKEQEKNFKGYEELLIEDEIEKEIHVNSDIHSTVKALQYALKHPVVNNHTLRLDTQQRPFLAYKRSDVMSRKRPETKAEKVSRAMESLKRMNTVIEAPLEQAIKDQELQKKYPEAAKLLHDIQRKYANVRSNTMSENRNTADAAKKSPRAKTQIYYMADKDTSVTDIHETQYSPSHL